MQDRAMSAQKPRFSVEKKFHPHLLVKNKVKSSFTNKQQQKKEKERHRSGFLTVLSPGQIPHHHLRGSAEGCSLEWRAFLRWTFCSELPQAGPVRLGTPARSL